MYPVNFPISHVSYGNNKKGMQVCVAIDPNKLSSRCKKIIQEKTSIMNNTKWEELRLGMLNLEKSPLWRTRWIENGYVCEWDWNWNDRFMSGGYKGIEWAEIKIENDLQREEVIKVLKTYNIPFESTELGYKVYGYITDL